MIRVTGKVIAAAALLGLVLVACGPTNAVKCTAANCSGCCTEAGECLGSSKQSRQACGSMGGECRVCLPDQLCGSGRCVRDPDASVILDDAGTGGAGGGGGGGGATGGGTGGGGACGQRFEACCTNMTCFLGLTCQRGVCDQPATDAGACGGVGAMCCANDMCTAPGTSCNGGFCTTGGAMDAGTDGGQPLRPTGAACSLDRECVDGTCLQIGFAGGYCTKACTTSANCFGGSQCGNNPSGVGPTKVCLTQCSMPLQAPGGCRTGYICEPNQGTAGVPVCFPGCTSNTQCGIAPTCDARGFCCGVSGFACCGGTMCEAGNTCSSGQCTSGGSGGGGGTGGGAATGGGAGGSGGGATGGGSGGGATGGGSGGGATGGGTGGGGFNMTPTGGACTSFLDCVGNTCFTTWSGGYCTHNCTSASCQAGSSCSPYVISGSSYCLQDCNWNGGQGNCRAGYVCDRYLINGTDQATCVVACPTFPCASGTTCQSGFCCGKPFYKCCAGNTCPGGGTCQANGYCQ